MRKIVLAVSAAVMLSGCVHSGPNQTGGALVGGAAGGLLGSMVGGGSGKLLATGVGAALGTIVGASVGESIDQQNQVVQQPHYAPTQMYGQNNLSGFNSAGEASAYNRGRAEREAEIQARREQNAYMRGLRGY